EVSDAAGITFEGSTLGIAVNDLNADGWPDIYVANDFISSDILYLNNQDGTFRNVSQECLRHTSFHGMGVDVADVNGDGHQDITVLDMLPFSNDRQKMMLTSVDYKVNKLREEAGFLPQVVRNTLQLNGGCDAKGDLQFSEVGTLAGIYATDWSWAPLWADYNLSGCPDLYVTNGYQRDITDLDLINGLDQQTAFGTHAHYDRVRREIQQTAPEIETANLFFQNEGGLNMKDRTLRNGLHHPSISHGAAFTDLDLDGDLDLVVNNVRPNAFVYRNNASRRDKGNYLKLKLLGKGLNRDGLGATVELRYQGAKQRYFHSYVRGYMSSMSHQIHFGLGNVEVVDTLVVLWPLGERQLFTEVAVNQLPRARRRSPGGPTSLRGTTPPLARRRSPTPSSPPRLAR
ncbi:MAG: CRTAC1 family protein, partial [Bacteroidota bacterium]